jgi:hypothetical protein
MITFSLKLVNKLDMLHGRYTTDEPCKLTKMRFGRE